MAISFELEFKLSEIYTDWLAPRGRVQQHSNKKVSKKPLWKGNCENDECRKSCKNCNGWQRWCDVDVFVFIVCGGAMYWPHFQLTSGINCVIRIYAGYLFAIHWITSLLFSCRYSRARTFFFSTLHSNYKMFSIFSYYKTNDVDTSCFFFSVVVQRFTVC